MDSTIENYLGSILVDVSRFKTGIGESCLTFSHRNNLYMIVYNLNYILTINGKYVLITSSPSRLVEVLKLILNGYSYEPDEFTRLIAQYKS